MTTWYTLETEDSVTDEVLALAESITDNHYPEGPIDWDNVWDRLDGAALKNGARLEIPAVSNPALKRIKLHIRMREVTS